MRQLRCADAGFECDAVVRDETDDQVMATVGQHAHEVHGVEVTPELADQLKGKITDA